MTSRSTVPIAIVIGGLIVAGTIYLSAPKPPDAFGGDLSRIRPVSAADHILGNPAAPVVIVEYTDFDCEFCKHFHDTMHQVVANAGADGDVAWVLREFPLTEIHPNAFALARAAECAAAGGNDAFWKFTDALFASQPAAPATLGTIASAAGISGNAFASCYANASTTLDARITADRRNALDMGAQGTPFSVILTNGKPPVAMEGAYSYDAVKQLVDEALTQ
jgi:protein-disulfide isomerase